MNPVPQHKNDPDYGTLAEMNWNLEQSRLLESRLHCTSPFFGSLPKLLLLWFYISLLFFPILNAEKIKSVIIRKWKFNSKTTPQNSHILMSTEEMITLHSNTPEYFSCCNLQQTWCLWVQPLVLCICPFMLLKAVILIKHHNLHLWYSDISLMQHHF